MTNAALNIQNELFTPLSLDIKINEDLTIRELLKPKGAIGGGDAVDVSSKATLDELNKNAQIQALLSASTPKISLNVVTGTTVIPGSDLGTVVPSVEGLGGTIDFSAAWAAGAAAGSEDRVLIAAMPFAAKILDVTMHLSTLGTSAATGQLRDAIAGGGNVLSDAFDCDAALGTLRDAGSALAGVVPTIAKGDPLVLRLDTNSDSAGEISCKLQRLS